VALISPWTYTTADYQGRVLSVTINFSVLGVIISATSHKDPGCQYGNMYFGLGADGTPDSTPNQVPIADGDNTIGLAVLNGFGFTTIQQVLGVQATAGP
jgi:hypothetical protein